MIICVEAVRTYTQSKPCERSAKLQSVLVTLRVLDNVIVRRELFTKQTVVSPVSVTLFHKLRIR